MNGASSEHEPPAEAPSSPPPRPRRTVEELEAELAAERDQVAALRAQVAQLRSDGEGGPAWQHEVVTFTGGTGFNSLCAELKRYTTRVAHVLPVSDDGGSTAEIVRVLGGPAVGDIRSRCLRLADESTREARAVKALLGHRLPSDPVAAKAEWHAVVEGEHVLWEGVSGPYKHTVRAFLAHFHFQLVRQANESDDAPAFCFSGGSVGNFFFAGARLFFRSLDAAVFLFSRVSGIPPHSLVLPVVTTGSGGRLMLGAELVSGELLRGQSTISHPPATGGSPACGTPRGVDKARGGPADTPLPSPVRRVLYLSTEDSTELHEVFPRVNPGVLARLATADAIVYGVGSLWSSICPSLIPAGVGEAVAARDCCKVLMLNGCRDRETTGMEAVDCVRAVVASLNREGASRGPPSLGHPARSYVTCVLSPQGGEFDAEAAKDALGREGIRVVTVPSERDAYGRAVYQPRAVIAVLASLVEQHRAELAERMGYVI